MIQPQATHADTFARICGQHPGGVDLRARRQITHRIQRQIGGHGQSQSALIQRGATRRQIRVPAHAQRATGIGGIPHRQMTAQTAMFVQGPQGAHSQRPRPASPRATRSLQHNVRAGSLHKLPMLGADKTVDRSRAARLRDFQAVQLPLVGEHPLRRTVRPGSQNNARGQRREVLLLVADQQRLVLVRQRARAATEQRDLRCIFPCRQCHTGHQFFLSFTMPRLSQPQSRCAFHCAAPTATARSTTRTGSVTHRQRIPTGGFTAQLEPVQRPRRRGS